MTTFQVFLLVILTIYPITCNINNIQNNEVYKEIVNKQNEHYKGRTSSYCIAKYLTENRIKSKEIMIFVPQFYSNVKEELWSELFLDALQLKSNKNLIIYSYLCLMCVKDMTADLKHLIFYVQQVEDIDVILRTCFCDNWVYFSEIFIIIPKIYSIYMFTDIIEYYDLHTVTIITNFIENSNEKYDTHDFVRNRCDAKQKFLNLTFECNASTKKITAQKLSLRRPDCPIRIGARLIEPFAFIMSLNSSRRHGYDNAYFGIEIMIIKYALALNYSDIIEYSENHELDVHIDPDKPTGLMKELYDGEIDLITGGLRVINHSVHTTNSYPYLYINFVAVVKRKDNKNILKLFEIFDKEVWFTYFIVGIILLCIIQIIRKKTFIYYSTQSLDYIIMFLFSILLGHSVHIKASALELISIFWIWFTFFLRVAFEVLLIYLLLNKDSRSQIDTLDELCDGNYKIFLSDVHYDSLNQHGLKLRNCKIPKVNMILSSNPLRDLYESKDANVAVFMFINEYNARLFEFIQDAHEEPFHIVKEVIFMVPLTLYFERGNPLLNRFNEKCFILWDIGFINHVVTTADFFGELNVKMKIKADPNKNHPRLLRMHHVQSIFYLHIMGIIISIIIFVIELIVFFM